jgi:hypothetical protein
MLFEGALPSADDSDEWDFFCFGAAGAPGSELLIAGKVHQIGQLFCHFFR